MGKATGFVPNVPRSYADRAEGKAVSGRTGTPVLVDGCRQKYDKAGAVE
jgi:hypothetical protein